jgi:hypothetical protein
MQLARSVGKRREVQATLHLLSKCELHSPACFIPAGRAVPDDADSEIPAMEPIARRNDLDPKLHVLGVGTDLPEGAAHERHTDKRRAQCRLRADDPTWAKLVRSLVDGGECFADVVGQWVFGGEGVAAGVDLDGAVAA